MRGVGGMPCPAASRSMFACGGRNTASGGADIVIRPTTSPGLAPGVFYFAGCILAALVALSFIYMKKYFGYVAVVAILVVPLVSFAAQFRTGDQPSVNAGERITDDVYIAGGGVTVAGSVVGDIIAAGGNVVVSGNAGADVMAAGGNVTILSDIADDLRAGGGSVVVQGKVGGDLIVGGGQVTIGGAGIGGDAVIGGGMVRIDAPVAGTLRIGGGKVYINAPISGAVTIEADELTLGSAAVLSGDLTYKATKQMVKEEGAVIKGKINFEPRAQRTVPAAAFGALFSLLVILKFFVLLVCALVVGLVFRRYSAAVVTRATARPMMELGRGLLVLVALPVLSVLALVTLVGIPFGVIGLLGFIVALLFAWIVTPIIVGSVAYQYLSKREWEVSWKSILLGTLIYTIAGVVPLVGGLAQCLLMLLSLGVVAAIKWETVREWR